jgi:1,4-alpha-glucan branching enzyme
MSCGHRTLPLAIAVVILVCSGCAAERWEGARVATGGVRFQMRQPDARSVAVAGDFNGWSQTSHQMTRNGDLWTCVIALPPGEHAFMYVVDGMSWVPPADTVTLAPDGFGGLNGKIVVP